MNKKPASIIEAVESTIFLNSSLCHFATLFSMHSGLLLILYTCITQIKVSIF
jgi:hypothetical protein